MADKTSYEAILAHSSITPRRTMEAALVDLASYGRPDNPCYGRGVGVLVRHFYCPLEDEHNISKWVFNKAEFISLSEIGKDGGFTA